MRYFWVKDNKYYSVKTQNTLFGTYDLIRSWGSLYNKLGNFKISSYTSTEEIDMQINNIAKTRKTRGYQLVFPINFRLCCMVRKSSLRAVEDCAAIQKK